MTSRIEWHQHPDADLFLQVLIGKLATEIPLIEAFAAELAIKASGRLLDWLDHLVLPDRDRIRDQLTELGFAVEEAPADAGDTVWSHPGAIFPSLLLRASDNVDDDAMLGAAIQVENVNAFLMTHPWLAGDIEGSPLSPLRRAQVWRSGPRSLWVVERRGYSGFIPQEMPADHADRYLTAYDQWSTRPRHPKSTRAGMEQALLLAQKLAGEMGPDTAAWIAFSAERSYWQRRNWAGQIQKARQDQLGLGWANHDHHTFRSSREVFTILIQILETFGFIPRERFYAGAEAGWGAQVMEQPTCRFAVFADVDLSPEEAAGDFAHKGLPPRSELGTVGLWCALHGESMLGAGLHHIAGRFAFDAATSDLAEHKVGMMHPFSEFSYLWQAFTRGERWQVAPERLDWLLDNKQITPGQRERFEAEGAVGSHLENIQRGDGFKGFNQQTVSDIIRRTDPRTEHGAI